SREELLTLARDLTSDGDELLYDVLNEMTSASQFFGGFHQLTKGGVDRLSGAYAKLLESEDGVRATPSTAAELVAEYEALGGRFNLVRQLNGELWFGKTFIRGPNHKKGDE